MLIAAFMFPLSGCTPYRWLDVYRSEHGYFIIFPVCESEQVERVVVRIDSRYREDAEGYQRPTGDVVWDVRNTGGGPLSLDGPRLALIRIGSTETGLDEIVPLAELPMRSVWVGIATEFDDDIDNEARYYWSNSVDLSKIDVGDIGEEDQPGDFDAIFRQTCL